MTTDRDPIDRAQLQSDLADQRDAIADQRDDIADERDRVADVRDAESERIEGLNRKAYRAITQALEANRRTSDDRRRGRDGT